MLERRSLIKGLVALVAAPAIVKASGLMVCSPTETMTIIGHDMVTPYSYYAPLTLNEITRESVRLFTDSNEFIKNLDYQYDKDFYEGEQWDAAKIGDVLRIRLPNGYAVDSVSHPADAFAYAMKSAHFQNPRLAGLGLPATVVPQIPTPLAVAALAVAAAPVVEQALQKPVTRRFWSK